MRPPRARDPLSQVPRHYIGILPLVTGIVGFCPLYSLLGIRTSAAP